MHRRRLLQLLGATAAIPPLRAFTAPSLAPQEEAFLDDMQRRGCLYFAEQVGAKTGEVLDRAAASDPR
jgi:ABC-type methionine transport system permease subunit